MRRFLQPCDCIPENTGRCRARVLGSDRRNRTSIWIKCVPLLPPGWEGSPEPNNAMVDQLGPVFRPTRIWSLGDSWREPMFKFFQGKVCLARRRIPVLGRWRSASTPLPLPEARRNAQGRIGSAFIPEPSATSRPDSSPRGTPPVEWALVGRPSLLRYPACRMFVIPRLSVSRYQRPARLICIRDSAKAPELKFGSSRPGLG